MKLKHTTLLVLCSVFMTGCVTDQIATLGIMITSTLINVTLGTTFLLVVVFTLNKTIKTDGQTNDLAVSIIATIIFIPSFLLIARYYWGLNWITIPISIIVGGLLGWFSYVLDDLLADGWRDAKGILLGGYSGLVFGGTLTVFMFSAVWLEGNMFITHDAICNRAVIERFDVSYTTDDEGHTTRHESWNYLTHVQKIAFGRKIPELQERRDYTLGYGDNGRRDRVRWERYYFIGGYFWSEKNNQWKEFRWWRLENPLLQFAMKDISIVRSNYFGNPIENGGLGIAPKDPPEITKPSLPSESELPSPTVATRTIGFIGKGIWLLFTEEEYRSLLYLMLSLYGSLGMASIFIPVVRPGVGAFVACSFILVLIIILFVAAKTGSIPGTGGRKRHSFAYAGRSGGGGGQRNY